MCCQDPPAPPDLGPAAEATEEVARIQQQTAREQLDWARERDTENRALLQEVLSVQMPAMREQFEQAQSDRERYVELFRPFEDRFAAEAEGYDTPERRQREMGAAMGDVSTQFEAQRRNALQRLEGYGVDPSQTRNAALDIGVRTAQAAAMAQAGTSAGRRVEDTGRALRSDVINMGRGALSNAAGFYGQSVGAGGAAQQGALNTTQSGAGAVQSSLGFSGQAMQGYGQSANTMSQNYGNQMSQWNAGQQQTAGTLQGIGTIGGMFLADGGEADPRRAVPFTDDGRVSTGMGDGSGVDDSVPAYLSDGEYVIPKDVVKAKGTDFFDKLVEKYHTPAQEQRRAI